MWNLKKIYPELIDKEIRFVVARGWGWGWENWRNVVKKENLKKKNGTPYGYKYQDTTYNVVLQLTMWCGILESCQEIGSSTFFPQGENLFM